MNNLVTSAGTLIEDFETLGDWTVSGTGATQEADTVNYKSGTQGLKLIMTGGNYGQSNKNPTNFNMAAATNFTFSVYFDDYTKVSYLIIYLATDAAFSKYFQLTLSGSNQYYTPGWNVFTVSKALFTNVGEADWADTIVRMRVRADPTGTDNLNVTWDNFRYNYTAIPTVIISFDDGSDDVLPTAYPVLAGNSQKATVFIISDNIDTAGNMTFANLATLYAAGWDIGNHTKTHQNLTGLSQEEMEAEIDTCYDWLIANGFNRSASLFAYPYGAFNAAIITKLKERHVLARNTRYRQYQAHFGSGVDDREYSIKGASIANTYTPTEVLADIDEVIINNGVLVLTFHNIVDADADASTKYLTADFQTISDYLKTQEDAGVLQVMKFSEYYSYLVDRELVSVTGAFTQLETVSGAFTQTVTMTGELLEED